MATPHKVTKESRRKASRFNPNITPPYRAQDYERWTNFIGKVSYRSQARLRTSYLKALRHALPCHLLSRHHPITSGKGSQVAVAVYSLVSLYDIDTEGYTVKDLYLLAKSYTDGAIDWWLEDTTQPFDIVIKKHLFNLARLHDVTVPGSYAFLMKQI